MGNKRKTSFNIRPLSAELRKKAEEEINETPARIEKDLKVLHDWFKEQPHLHKIKPSDQWLLAFLRGCKYNMEKAQKKVDMYYTLKSTLPEFYANRDPFDPNIQIILKSGVFLPLLKCSTPVSPRVCISRVGQFNSLGLPLKDLMKVSLMILEIMLMEDDNCTIMGEEVIADLQNMGFGILWQWTPSLARNITACSQKVLSVRLKSLHILHPPFGIGPAIALFRLFLGAKIRNRVHSHGPKFDSLYSHIDKSILPKELGGSEGTIQDLIDHWKRKVESYRDWFMDVDSLSDETKRV